MAGRSPVPGLQLTVSPACKSDHVNRGNCSSSRAAAEDIYTRAFPIVKDRITVEKVKFCQVDGRRFTNKRKLCSIVLKFGKLIDKTL